MKKLYIVRHTQKEEEFTKDDYDRDLSPEGLEKAKLIAENFAKKNIPIDLIVASPAIRTKKTISYTFDTVDSMLLVGHNPSLTALAITLVGFKEKFEQGAIMQIIFDCDSWIDISVENAKLVSYELPNI